MMGLFVGPCPYRVAESLGRPCYMSCLLHACRSVFRTSCIVQISNFIDRRKQRIGRRMTWYANRYSIFKINENSIIHCIELSSSRIRNLSHRARCTAWGEKRIWDACIL